MLKLYGSSSVMKKNLNRSLDGLHLQVQIKEGESTYQIVMQNQVGATYTQIIVFTCRMYTSKKVVFFLIVRQ